MNIRQAIFAAADQIERHPGRFSFSSCKIPYECGSPGCAIGWVGFFLGEAPGAELGDLHVNHPGNVMDQLGGDAGGVFYSRMTALVTHGWMWDANLCARGMRLYADKYHPSEGIEEVRGMPANVRAIFDMTPAELAREFA